MGFFACLRQHQNRHKILRGGIGLGLVSGKLEKGGIDGTSTELSGEGVSVGGGWRCRTVRCRSAPGLPKLPPVTPKNPSPFVASRLLFCYHGDGSNQYSIWTAGG
jgi:hypothetical protein